MREAIKSTWEKRPLSLILFVGIIFRLLAVIFSKGFGMHDDHFLIVESSQSWADGFDYNNWLPSSGATTPDGHSLFYPGLHFLLFKYLHWRGIDDPQGKMYIVRALNALWSLLTIIFGFKLTEHYAGKKVARQAGMMLSILWFMPMLAVRDLVEMYCIPALMTATWLLVDPTRRDRMRSYVLAGFFCGIAFNTRFQSMLLVGTIGLMVLLERKWKPFFMYCLGMFISVFPMQGLFDLYLWHKPFAELFEYIHINANNYNDFVHGPWYNYLLLIGGILIPPIGIFILFGYFRTGILMLLSFIPGTKYSKDEYYISLRKYAIIFWPSFIFLAFHSSYPNKQERFILPIVPFVLILGLVSWTEFMNRSTFWQKKQSIMKYSWVFFWTLNLIALPVISTMYSKKNRVESMSFLRTRSDLHGLMIEESYDGDFLIPPLFYVGRWNVHVVGITNNNDLEKAYLYYKDDPREWVHPNYVVFLGKRDIDNRVAKFKKIFPHTDSVTTIYPSLVDNILEWLNPRNQNQTSYIYHFTEQDVTLPGKSATSAYKPESNH